MINLIFSNAAEGNSTHPKNDSNQPKYIIQRHDKPEILEIVGVKAGENDIEGGKRELIALVAYVDNTFEFVPTSVLKEFAPVVSVFHYSVKNNQKIVLCVFGENLSKITYKR